VLPPEPLPPLPVEAGEPPEAAPPLLEPPEPPLPPEALPPPLAPPEALLPPLLPWLFGFSLPQAVMTTSPIAQPHPSERREKRVNVVVVLIIMGSASSVAGPPRRGLHP